MRKDIRDRGKVAFSIAEDGSLSNKRAERYALLLADEVVASEAWKLTGGSIGGGSSEYRRRMENYGPFKERLAVLAREKEELMADDLFGEAKWMANQMWREARATGNATMMQKAAEMRMKILEKEEARRPVEAAQSGVQTQGRPGKPSVENPQAQSSGMSDLKRRLLANGVAPPGQKGADGVRDGGDSAPPNPLGEAAPAPSVVAVDFDAQLERLLPA